MIEITKAEFEDMKTTLIEENEGSGTPMLITTREATIKGEPVQSDMEVLSFNGKNIAYGQDSSGYFKIEEGDLVDD